MKQYIKVLLGTKQQLQCKKVEFTYEEGENPTISDVKAAARAQLHSALEGCSVQLQMPNNAAATLSDTELYSPDDNIWIDATDPVKRSKTSSTATVSNETVDSTADNHSSDESLTYTITHEKTTLTLFRRNTYMEWSTDNDASIRILYRMAKPKTDLFLGNTNIYDFYDATMTRGLIVLIYFRNAVPNIAVLDEAKKRLKNHTTDMTYKSFTTNDFSTHAKLATEVLNKWLNTNFIPTWSAAGCNSPISQALRSRGYRGRKTSGIRKSGKIMIKDDTALMSEAFSTVLEAMKVTPDNSALENMYKTTASIRRPWLTVLLHDSASFENAIDVFFDKLPFLSDNLHWLHYDFAECMEKNFSKVPKFVETFTTFASSIISTATQQNLTPEEHDDMGLTAADALVHLINKYCKLKEICKMDSILLTDTERKNEHDLLLLKNAITIKPMIIMTSDDDGRNYYVALQRRMLKITNSDFTEALRLYLEIFYIFDLPYDPSPAPFFEFFSIMEGIAKVPKASLQNLIASIQFVHDTTHATCEEESAAVIQQHHSDNNNLPSGSNSDNGSENS